MIKSYFKFEDKHFTLINEDVFEVLPKFEFEFNMIFADPPYFLSHDGLTIKNGKISSVNKGNWDKSYGFDEINKFNYNWLSLVRKKLASNGTIWISGTAHNIFSIGQMLQELDFKILNIITWEKTNRSEEHTSELQSH